MIHIQIEILYCSKPTVFPWRGEREEREKQVWTKQDYFSPTAFRNFPNDFSGRHVDLPGMGESWSFVLRISDKLESPQLSL